MLILAVEQSCTESTAVITDETVVLSSIKWTESRLRSQLFFPGIERMLKKCNHTLKNIDLFAAGTGPGAFNALRMCVSAMQAYALPGKKEVYAVPSPQALALQLHTDRGVSRISIVGDARRGSLWLANYTFIASCLPAEASIELIKPMDLNSALTDSELIASPDFDRIANILTGIPGRTTRLIQDPVYPRARFIAKTAHTAILQGISSPPFTPTYLHPAV